MYENSQCLVISDSILSRPFDVNDTRQSFTYQVMHQCPVNMCMVAGSGQSLSRRSDLPGRIGFGVDLKQSLVHFVGALGVSNVVINLGANDISNADTDGLENYVSALDETVRYIAKCGAATNLTVISPLLVPSQEENYFPSSGIPDIMAFKISDYRQACADVVAKYEGRFETAVRYCAGTDLVGSDPSYWVTPHLSGLGHIEAATNFVAWMQDKGIFPASYT